MDKHFGFQYGKILLALSTKPQLEAMLDKDWPFFDKFKTELVGCLNGTTCRMRSFDDHINILGIQDVNSIYHKTNKYLFADANVSKEVVIHPPNLVAKNGTLHPNALIPFCAYQTKMLGERVDTATNRSFVACSHFEQTILDGQLCSSIDVNRVAKKKSGAGKRNGLLLVIDAAMNPEQKRKYRKLKSIDHMITTLNIEQKNTDTQGVKIYINTLEKFETFSSGKKFSAVM